MKQRKRTLALLFPLVTLFLLACNLTAVPPTTGTPPVLAPETAPSGDSAARLVVAWAEAGNLIVWREGEAFPRRIASGGVVRPLLSPDSRRVAYTRGPQGIQSSLWAADVDGVAEREIAGRDQLSADGTTRLIDQVAWQGTDTLIFNTRVQVAAELGGGFTDQVDDLWRADAVNGSAVRLLPEGQGGNFSISPDGALMTLSQAGRSTGEQSVIRLADAQGVALGELLRFENVLTASEYRFYPAVHWLPDSSAVLVAIPHPDLIYDPALGVALWRLGVDGSALQIGSVPATFFGLPRWSADGAWLAYARQVGPLADNTLALLLARGDGRDGQQIASVQAGLPGFGGWGAGGLLYTVGEEGGAAWLAAPGGAPARFPGEGESVYTPLWADANTVVYLSAPGGAAGGELRYVQAGGTTQTIAAIAEGFPVFTAGREP